MLKDIFVLFYFILDVRTALAPLQAENVQHLVNIFGIHMS